MSKFFPIEVKKESGQKPFKDKRYIIANESQKYYRTWGSNFSIANISNGVTGGLAWREAVKGTTAVNTWFDIFPGFVLPTCGRTLYIYKIKIDTTDACGFGIRHSENGSAYASAPKSTPLLNGVFQDLVYYQNNPLGGTIEIDFVKEEGQPRKVRYGEQMGIWACSTNESIVPTEKTNYLITISGIDCPADENYEAEYLMGTIGDSTQVPVSDIEEPEYSESTGSVRGIWQAIVRKHLNEKGINCRWSGLALGGSNITYWEVKVERGLFSYWKPDILFCGSGINDAAGSSTLRTTTGVDGIFTKAYKSVIKSYFQNVPNGCMVINQATDVDTSAQTTVISGGIYDGLTRIEAIRLEITAVVNELKSEFPNYDLELADTSPAQTFLASEKSNYVTAEQSTGASVHPNAREGQPKMAVKIIEAVENTSFYEKNAS